MKTYVVHIPSESIVSLTSSSIAEGVPFKEFIYKLESTVGVDSKINIIALGDMRCYGTISNTTLLAGTMSQVATSRNLTYTIIPMDIDSFKGIDFLKLIDDGDTIHYDKTYYEDALSGDGDMSKFWNDKGFMSGIALLTQSEQDLGVPCGEGAAIPSIESGPTSTLVYVSDGDTPTATLKASFEDPTET